MSGWYHWDGDDLTLRLRIQPKASRDTFVGPHGDDFKIRITAPPVDGKANTHLIKLLAKAFGVPRSQVTLVSGETSRSTSESSTS
ncbi:MAG: YggU family protein [gamma proteobacterium endosymbiont of Lamellibrachia anaximandri]|nr:YggU family protein [gamma proteobacterium endosymbiont of Lamellibrachia anaximandri]